MRPESPRNRRRDLSTKEFSVTRRQRGERGGYFHREPSPDFLEDELAAVPGSWSDILASQVPEHRTANGVARFLHEVGFTPDESETIYAAFGEDTIAEYATFITTYEGGATDPNEVFLQLSVRKDQPEQSGLWDAIEDSLHVFGRPLGMSENLEDADVALVNGTYRVLDGDQRVPLDEALLGSYAHIRTLAGVRVNGLPGGYTSRHLIEDIANDNYRDLD